MKRLSAVLLVFLLVLATPVTPARAEEINIETLYLNAIQLVSEYLITMSEEDLHKLDLAYTYFEGLGRYRYCSSFKLYIDVLRLIESDDDARLTSTLMILQWNSEFNSWLLDEDRGVPSVDALSAYIAGRQYEAQGKNESALASYNDCLNDFDTIDRVVNLTSSWSVKYELACKHAANGEYLEAANLFAQLAEYGYGDSKARYEALSIFLNKPASTPTPKPTPSPAFTFAPESSPSPTPAPTPSPTPPPKRVYTAPTVKISSSSNWIYMAWDAVEGAVSYNIYRKKGNNGEWSMLTSTNLLTYNDYSVAANVYYVYKVSAVSDDNHEEFSIDRGITFNKKAWSAWSDWSTSAVEKTSTREVETKTQYRYRIKTYTTSSSSALSGWTLESSTPVSYGAWSDWSQNFINKTDSIDVESSTFYRYYYFHCTCGWRSPYWGSNYACRSCGKYEIKYESAYLLWSQISYSNSNSTRYDSIKLQTTSVGSGVFYYESAMNFTETRYRSRAIIPASYKFYKWSAWSNWSDSAIGANSTTEVSTRKLYRYRDYK